MDTSSSEEQEPIAQIAEGELTDEALEASQVCLRWLVFRKSLRCLDCCS
jgi:hypothetical protein